MSSLDLFRLDGKAAVVTGGAGGLGAAIARGLAEAGAAVAVA
ncbi:MAG TPA: short-chain dehydrogenase, partial [Methylomirabilota bacterium]|nr:short-chain dehydrogenase [Methylomirabilota bacterium]